MREARTEALREILSTRVNPVQVDLLKDAFPQQRKFIEDPKRLKALFCTRRAAKSYTDGMYLVKEALEHRNTNCLFIGLTRMSAKGIIWKDVLKTLDRKYNLGIRFNETELTATFPNGSIIYVTGVDVHEDEMNKLLGKKYRLVCVDEGSMYGIDMRQLIYGVLAPATADYLGTICLTGTASDIVQGLFFDVTRTEGAREPGWSVHEWSAHDNPHVAKQWAQELAEIARDRPLFMKTPLFRQWYLNEWVVDTEKLCYSFDEDANSFFALPRATAEWSYVLGVDLGYKPDPSAFVVVAFNDHDPNLYMLETFKALEMDVTDVANKIKEFQSRFNIFKVVIDGANKQAVEEIQRRHGIALTSADKRGKSDFIAIMNGEFVQQRIKLSADCNNLKEEYKKLIWKTEQGNVVFPREEHPGCANHLADAALYAWRFTYTYLSEAPKAKADPRSREAWLKHTQKLMEESLAREVENQKSDEMTSDFWATTGMEPQDVLNYHVNKRRK